MKMYYTKPMAGVTLESIMRPASIIDDQASVRDALERMNKEKANELLVVNEDGVLVGEVSVSDVLGAAVPSDLDGDDAMAHLTDEDAFSDAIKEAADRPLTDCMSSGVESIRMDARLIDVAATAISMGQARIPVVDNDDRPVGIISRQGLRHILSVYMDARE
jgi:CBS domain-containing protein